MKKEWTAPEMTCLNIEETNGVKTTGTGDGNRSVTTGQVAILPGS